MKRKGTSIILWLIAISALLAGAIAVSASMIDSSGGEAPQDSLPETVEPAPETTRIPPPPDSFPTQADGGQAPREAPEIPNRGDVLLGADGKYAAVAKNGCVWKETTRSQDIAENDIVILQTNCANDLILHYNPATGDVRPVGVFVVPEEKQAPPAPTAENREQPEPPTPRSSLTPTPAASVPQ